MICTLPFIEVILPSWSPLAYDNWDRQVVIVAQTNMEYQEKIIEDEIEVMLNHESLHAVIHKRIDVDASKALDKIDSLEQSKIRDVVNDSESRPKGEDEEVE